MSSLGERFSERQFLGAGRYAEVYRSYDRIQRRPVALKVLKFTDPATIVRLRREFGRISRLRTVLHSSPHLVGYYRLLIPHRAHDPTHDQRPLLSMEFVPGGIPVHRWLEASVSPLDRIERLEPALPQILRGLSTLHAMGLVHRDISPGNILISESSSRLRAVLVDYGLSLPGAQSGFEARSRGTFVAPEERGPAATTPVSMAADIWALGMTLCDLTLGRPAVPGASPLPRLARADLDPRWTRALERMLQPDPGQRPHAAELIQWFQPERGSGAHHPSSPGPERPLAIHDPRQTEHHRRLLRALRGETIESSVVQIVGRVGSGVSSLLESALEDFGNDERPEPTEPPLVLRVECDKGLFQSHGAVRALGDALLGPLDERREELTPLPGARELARIIEGLSLVDRLFEGDAPPTEPEATEEPERRAREALRELFGRLSQRRRVAVVIEGAHRGDRDSAHLLTSLLDPPLPGVVIVLVRPPLPGPLDALCERVVHPCQITLDPTPGLPEATPTVLDGEPDEALLRPLAIACVPLPAETIVELAGLTTEQDRAVGRLFELEDRGVLDTVDDGERLVLPRGPLRDSVVAATEPDERTRLHDLLADLLRREAIEDPTPRFHHLVGADRYHEAAEQGSRAACFAAARLAFGKEVEIRRALVELPGGESDAARMTELGMALIRAGETLESGTVLDRAATLLREAGGPARERDRLLRLAGRQMMFAGDFERGKQLFLRAAAELGLRPPRSPGRALLEALLRRLVLVVREAIGGILPAGFRPDPDPLQTQSLWDAAMATAMVDYPTSDALAMRHLAAVRGTRLRSEWLRALSREAASCANLGGRWFHRRARRMQRACADLGAQSRDPLDLAWIHFADRSTAWFRADWSSAADAARAAERVLRLECSGVAWDLAVNNVFLTSALAMMGEVDELRDRVAVILRDARARDDHYTATSLRLGEPVIGFAHGDCATALDLARRELQTWPLHEIPGLLFPWIQTLVSCALYEGLADRAAPEFEPAWAAVARTGLVRLECVGSILLHARGRMQLATGHPGEVRRIAARLRRCSLPMGRAMGLALTAGLVAAEQPELAQARLDESAGEFERCSMRIYAAACRHRRSLLGRGTPASSGRPDNPDNPDRPDLLGLPRPDRIADALVPMAALAHAAAS